MHVMRVADNLPIQTVAYACNCTLGICSDPISFETVAYLCGGFRQLTAQMWLTTAKEEVAVFMWKTQSTRFTPFTL